MPQPSWKVNEIFYSIQGEGRHTGMPAVFVRLAGCSMNCPFCDTKYAARDGKTMSAPELLAALSAWPAKAAIITGGEPTEQDLPALIAVLKDAGYQVHLETNGAKDTDVSQADFVCVSPKKYVSAEMLKKPTSLKSSSGKTPIWKTCKNTMRMKTPTRKFICNPKATNRRPSTYA